MVNRKKTANQECGGYCSDHTGVKTDTKNLWAITLLIFSGVAYFAYWTQGELAEARIYTDRRCDPIVEVRDTVIEMEVNLRTYMEQQGYKYQETKKKR